jgi:hypothetical protein
MSDSADNEPHLGLPLLAIDANDDYQCIRLTKDGKVMLHEADRERIEKLMVFFRQFDLSQTEKITLDTPTTDQA